MSYGELTIEDVKSKLGLRLVENQSLYDAVGEVAPSTALTDWLRETVPLAFANNTEKARSELILCDVIRRAREAATGAE